MTCTNVSVKLLTANIYPADWAEASCFHSWIRVSGCPAELRQFTALPSGLKLHMNEQ